MFVFLFRADDTGFTCQQCGLVRSKEDIKNIASQIKSISDEASTSMSSQSIPLCLTINSLMVVGFWSIIKIVQLKPKG